MKDINLKERALRIIGAIASEYSCSTCYRITHAATEDKCKHPEWEKNIALIYDDMVKSGILPEYKQEQDNVRG